MHECHKSERSIERRVLVKAGALALVALGLEPIFLTRAAYAAKRGTGPADRTKTLVCLFQRGAADGLNMVVPHGDPIYYRERPRIAIPRPGTAGGALDLDGHFGLHPVLAPLKALYDNGTLAIVHAVGSPESTRSHFDAQDYMESGTPGLKSTPDGWLNRYLGARQGRERQDTLFRGVAIGPQLPRALRGSAPALAIDNSQAFALRAPEPSLDRSLRQIAQLIKADLGLEIAFADVGGWDTHVNQGATEGQLAARLTEFARAIAAFTQDLGERMADVVVITMSEFGRTVAENGNVGTDHGHATAMFVLGGGVRGGRVYGEWPTLEPAKRFEGRDLAVTTDFRDLFSEVLTRHLGATDLGAVFPGYRTVKPVGVLPA